MAEQPNRFARRLAAVLAADVAGYSRLIGLDEEGTLTRLGAHRRELIDRKVAAHDGRIVKTTGDGFLAEFASVLASVRCGSEIQAGMSERNAGIAPAPASNSASASTRAISWPRTAIFSGTASTSEQQLKNIAR